MAVFNQFIDDYGVYFVLSIMVFLAFTIVYTTLPIKRYKPEIWTVRFVCPACGGNGEAKNDPYFECLFCRGLGIVSFPIRIGHSIFDDYKSRLEFRANLTPNQRERFIGFQPKWQREGC